MRDVVFALCYTQHGGSGLNFSRADVLDMFWDEALWYFEKLNEVREAEAKQIQESMRG